MLARGQVAQCRLSSFPVVEAFDVLEHSQPNLLSGGEFQVVDYLGFIVLKKLSAMALSQQLPFAHTLQYRHSLLLGFEGTAGVLHAAVGVKQKGVGQRPVSRNHLPGS